MIEKIKKSIFDYKDIHSHVEGSDRVMSVDFGKGGMPEGIPEGQAVTVGVHPWRADNEIDWDAFEKSLLHPGVVGVGEAGLDSVKGPSMERQLEVFERQIELSEKTGLPLVIHSVRNNHRILELKKKYSPKMPWIIHGFRGNIKEARQLIGAGIHISLGRYGKIGELSALPAAFIHFETDEEG